MKTCTNCDKLIEDSINYCSWDCHVELAKKDGGKVIAPNNLPIMCVTADGTMLEHEHGDHPDYKFPVEIEYLGPIDTDCIQDYKMCSGEEGNDKQIRNFMGQTHALIYADGYVAVTLYECTYFMWLIKSGLLKNAGPGMKVEEWKMTDLSLLEILNRLSK